MSYHDHKHWRVEDDPVPVRQYTFFEEDDEQKLPVVEEHEKKVHRRRRASILLQRDPPDYKPLPLRWPFLVGTVAIMITLIALVAMACTVLPAEVDRSAIPTSADTESKLTGSSSVTASRVPLLRRRGGDPETGGFAPILSRDQPATSSTLADGAKGRPEPSPSPDPAKQKPDQSSLAENPKENSESTPSSTENPKGDPSPTTLTISQPNNDPPPPGFAPGAPPPGSAPSDGEELITSYGTPDYGMARSTMHASEGPVTLTRTLDNSVGNAGGPPAGFAPSDVLKSTITSYVDDPKATSTSNSKGAGYAGSEKHGKEGPVTLENTLVEDPTASSSEGPADVITNSIIFLTESAAYGILGEVTLTRTIEQPAAGGDFHAGGLAPSTSLFNFAPPRPPVTSEIVTTVMRKTTLDAPSITTTVVRQTTLPGIVSTITGQTVLRNLISTVTVQTTLNGVLSTLTQITTGADGVPTTLLVTTTLNGVVSTFTSLTTLSAATSLFASVTTLAGEVKTFSEVRTLGKAVVSDYAEVLTTKTLLTANAAGAYYYSYETVRVLTLTDSNGVSTATVIRTPPVFYTPTVVTLSNSAGVPTATLSTSALVAPRVTTLKNSDGVPTATVTEYPAYPSGNSSSRTTPKQQQPQTVIQVYYMSNAQYFTGFFLPPILSVMLTIPIRMIDLSAKQFQPWHELTRRQGATAYESLCLKTDGFYGIASSIRSLAGGQALIFLTTLLTLCSVILVPLSAEAIALKLHGSCSVTDFRGCAMTLGVFLAPARAAMALLGLMVVLVVLILIVLYRWRSGVASNPWTITGTASLSTNPEVRALLRALPAGRDERIQHNQLLKALDGRTFKLGYFFNRHGVPEYGIMIHQEVRPLSRDSESTSLEKGDGPETEGMTHKTGHHLPFLMLSYKGRISFLVLLTGVMIVILYYNTTSGDSPFESFMDTSNFGVRALFTLVGVGITFSWSSFFTSLAVLSPYQLLAQARQPAERSIILSPPLNAFVGIWSAIRRRHVFLVIVAFTAILSEFMPLLLSNVPFRVTQTWTTHLVCTWLATAILGVMWLVVAGGFFVRWPHMPVDPSTIAGAMYYVCDSWVVWSLEGLSVLGEKERDRKVQAMGLKYELGNIVGLEGRRRIGVDGIHDHS